MAKGSTHQSAQLTKLLYVGDSGTGKTGSLISLLKAGYELRFLDMDNGLDWLINEVRRTCPELLDNIDYITIRDEMKADKNKGAKLDARSRRAFVQAMEYLEKWDDDSKPSEWGEKTILVIDSLTFLSRAALYWAGEIETRNNLQAIYGTAQDAVLKMLDLLTSENFRTNVIVTAHYEVRENEDTKETWTQVTAVGKALGKKVPAAFNNMVVAATATRKGESVRQIYLKPVNGLAVKAGTTIDKKVLPLETGMAELFEALRGQNV